MSVLKKFKVFCETENQYVETWKENTPQCCPTDYRHVIDPTRTEQIDQKFEEVINPVHVYINSKAFRNTNGTYCGEGRSFVIPSNTTTHTENIVVDYPMCVFGMKLCVREEHFGDSVSFVGMPDTLVGVTLQPVDTSTTTFLVSDTVVANVIPGFYITLGSEQRKIVATNKNDKTITIASPVSSSYPAGTPLFLNVYIIKDFRLDAPGINEVGYGAFGGKVIPQGATLRLIYNKADPQAEKTFSFNVEFMY